MRHLVGYLVAGLAFQSGPRPRPATSTATRACIPTEHMPIAGVRSRAPEPMPVARPDSTSHARMPVVEAVPCYLAEDSSRVSRSRPGASRDSSADTTRPPAR